MNFKFSYKWFLFMPNEHFTSEAEEKSGKKGEDEDESRRSEFFDK